MAECTCRGGNPNCFKCGGFGEVGVGWGPAIPSRTQSQSSKGSKPKKRLLSVEKVKCPYCSKRKTSLHQHVKDVHPEMLTNFIQVNGMKLCPHCLKLNVKDLHAHMLSKHPELVPVEAGPNNSPGNNGLPT